MLPYLDLFLILVVLLEAALPDGEAAGGRRSVTLLSRGGSSQCCLMGRLQFTMPDGKAASCLCSVTRG